MRTTKALFATILFMLIAGPTWPTASPAIVYAAADDASEEESDEYDVTARVMRTSMLQGEVTLRRAGAQEWERATLNLPLLEGDTVATASGARLEIQIDARNFLRVGADSVLRIVTLRDNGIALSLTQGTVTLRLARFDATKEYFEMDAPKSTLSAEKPGLYRLDVTPEGRVRFTVRDSGRARIYSETAGFTLREERTAELIDAGAEEGDWQLAAAAAFDAWDTWIEERERYLATHLRYEERERYYDQDIWGAEELDDYGDWVSAPEYGGWVWCPRPTAVNSYPNWAPYRHGHWRWSPPYGWTWVADEPWGWAPYHYGRWVYYNNNWCWAPRGHGYRQRRNPWRPALVAIINVSDQVAWYPLTHGQHDPYRRNRGRHEERPGQPRPHDRGNRHPVNPGGVTCVPARDFGNRWARPRPATTEIARRAVNNDPTQARLPQAPRGDSDRDVTGNRDRDRRARNWPGRNASVNPPGNWRERPTGAAARRPGAPLDGELRRTRLYNGRAPQPSSSPVEGGAAQPSDRSTGAVERPSRSFRPSRDQDTDVDRSFRNNGPSRERPERPARTRPQDGSVQRPPGLTPSPGERPREQAPRERAPREPGEPRQPRAPRAEPPQTLEPRAEAPLRPSAEVPPQPTEPNGPADSNGPAAARPERPQTAERPSRPERRAPVERDEPMDRPTRRPERLEPPQPSRAPQPQAAQPSIEAAQPSSEAAQPQAEAPGVAPSAPVTQPEPPTVSPAAATAQPSTPEPQPVTPAPQPERAEPQPEAPRVETATPAPPPDSPAPQREAPPPQREEPARREEPPPTPAPPPEPVSAPPPAPEPSSPPPSPPSDSSPPPSPPPAPDPPAPAPEPPRSDPPPAPEPRQPEAAAPPQY
jgi:Family of unknown function (DUF6600)